MADYFNQLALISPSSKNCLHEICGSYEHTNRLSFFLWGVSLSYLFSVVKAVLGKILDWIHKKIADRALLQMLSEDMTRIYTKIDNVRSNLRSTQVDLNAVVLNQGDLKVYRNNMSKLSDIERGKRSQIIQVYDEISQFVKNY